MKQNPDIKNYNYDTELSEIMELSATLVEKIASFGDEAKKLPDSIHFYNLLKEDLSHIREGLVMKPQINSKLSTKQKEILDRRRSLKNIHEVLYKKKLLTQLQNIKVLHESANQRYNSGIEFNENKKYAMRTDLGAEILRSLIEDGVREVFDFSYCEKIAGGTIEEITEASASNTIGSNVINMKDESQVIRAKSDPVTDMIHDKASSSTPTYFVNRMRKAWYIVNTFDEVVFTHKKLTEVVDFLIYNGIELNQLLVQDGKHNFELLYISRKDALEEDALQQAK